MAEKEDVQEWVREAVAEALDAANLVDGPTHIRHHQMMEDFCVTLGQVKKTGIAAMVTVVVGGMVTILVLGFRHWVKG